MADETCKEKEYTFVQETIRPKKKNSMKKVAITVGTAILFGIVSGIAFCACLPLFSDYFQIDSSQIIIGKGEGHSSSILAPAASETPASIPTALPTEEPKKTKEPSLVTESGQNDVLSETIQDICAKVNRSIVKVESMKASYDVFSSGDTTDTGATCGIVVAKSQKNLLIYVNKARIEESQNIVVTFQNNKVVPASVYSKQEELGIAILAVELSKLTKEELDTVEVADFNSEEEVKTGQAVVEVGNPNGHLYSFAYGYVSNAPYDAYIIDNAITLINTTIEFNANGDGVLVNMAGEVIGFISHASTVTSEMNYNINTCYSLKQLKPIITKLVNKATDIYVGVTASDITPDIAYKTNVSAGLYIMGIENNSPAFYADLKKGDIITAVDDESITSAMQFNTVINQYKENEKIMITYLRTINGKQVTKKAAVQVSAVK